MANLDTLTCDYNTLAEANGFPTKSKRFRSYDSAKWELAGLQESIKDRKLKQKLNLQKSQEEVERLTGWDTDLVRSLSDDERLGARRMANLIEVAEEGQNKWLESFDTNPIYALQWAEDIAVASFKADIARRVLNGFEKQAGSEGAATFKGWTKLVRDDLNSQMISNSFRGGSTSAFHNATEDAKRQAVSHMLSSYGFFVWVDYED